MQSIPDESIDMVMCDLPYGITQNKWDSVIPLEKLWKEYKRIYSRAIYEKGRKKILKNFLLREKLYLSDPFIVNYDKIARHNILLELNS